MRQVNKKLFTLLIDLYLTLEQSFLIDKICPRSADTICHAYTVSYPLNNQQIINLSRLQLIASLHILPNGVGSWLCRIIILIIKVQMRTLLRRNHRNEPSAKNIIKNTTIQVDDIRSKMRKAEQRELRFDLESSISQIAPSDNVTVDHKYRQVMEEFNRLKHENRLLVDQNRLLNQQNQRLNLQEERSRNISQLNSVLLSKNDSEALREKVLLLDQEKKRVQRELAAEKEKSQQSYKNMDKLRMELLLLRGDRTGAAAGVPAPGQQESRFMLLSNSILADYQDKMGRRLQELNFRINRIQMMEKIIKEQHSRLTVQSRVNKTPSSVKSNYNNTTFKNDSRYKEQPQTQERSQREQPLPLSSSPIDRHYRLDESILERLEQENLTLAEELRLRDSQIERMKIERERMSAVLHDLQLQRKSYRISTPKFNNEPDGLKRFTGEEVVYSQEIQQLRAEKDGLREELAALQGSVAIERREFGTKIDYLQKIIRFYQEKQTQACEQCQRKDEEIALLKEKLKKSDERFEGSLIQLQRKFQTEIQDYQRKLQHSESAGSERFRSLQDEYQRSRQMAGELVIELGNYKMMLEYIKDKIHLEPIAHLLNQNTAIYSQVESTFYQEREEYDRSIASYKQQVLDKEQQMFALETQLHLREKQLQLLREEVEKLRQVNMQLQDNNLNVLRSNLKFMGRDRVSKAKSFESNHQKVLELVRSGETKLDILYQKIHNTLNFDLVHPRNP